jgi:hypothetical protein
VIISVEKVVASNPKRQRVIPKISYSFSTLCSIIKRTPNKPTTNPDNPNKLILDLKISHEKKATVRGSILAIITEILESIFVKAKKIRPR